MTAFADEQTPMKRYSRRNLLGGMLAGAAGLSALDAETHAADANLVGKAFVVRTPDE